MRRPDVVAIRLKIDEGEDAPYFFIVLRGAILVNGWKRWQEANSNSAQPQEQRHLVAELFDFLMRFPQVGEQAQIVAGDGATRQ